MGADVNSQERTKVRDPRWLRVERCKDHYMGRCHRSENECRFAHPDSNCVIEKNKVTVCYDSMKGKCNRNQCKFYHPPMHIREYLIAFGKVLEQERLEKEQTEAENSDAESTCAFSDCSRSTINSISSRQNSQQHENTSQYDHQSVLGHIRPRFIHDYPQTNFANPADSQPPYLLTSSIYQSGTYHTPIAASQNCLFLRPETTAGPPPMVFQPCHGIPTIPIIEQPVRSCYREPLIYNVPYQTIQAYRLPYVGIPTQFGPVLQNNTVYYPQNSL